MRRRGTRELTSEMGLLSTYDSATQQFPAIDLYRPNSGIFVLLLCEIRKYLIYPNITGNETMCL